MAQPLTEDRTFSHQNFGESQLAIGTYDNCRFEHCNFTGADFSQIIFLECKFSSCDFSNCHLPGRAFREVHFADGKMVGVHFKDEAPKLFAAMFQRCNLEYASFFQMKLRGTIFQQCNLQEADFVEADLTGAELANCNLRAAKFEHSILEKADFRTAQHYTIDPELNRVRKAKFSLPGVVGLLEKYGIEVEF